MLHSRSCCHRALAVVDVVVGAGDQRKRKHKHNDLYDQHFCSRFLLVQL